MSKPDYRTQAEVQPIWDIARGCPFPGQGTSDSILGRPTSRIASHYAVHPPPFIWQEQRKKPALALFALWLPTSWAGRRAGKGACLWIFIPWNTAQHTGTSRTAEKEKLKNTTTYILPPSAQTLDFTSRLQNSSKNNLPWSCPGISPVSNTWEHLSTPLQPPAVNPLHPPGSYSSSF